MNKCSTTRSGHDIPSAVNSPDHQQGHDLTIGLHQGILVARVLTHRRLPGRSLHLADPVTLIRLLVWCDGLQAVFGRGLIDGRRVVAVQGPSAPPGKIISHCVWLYHRFPLSFREVEEMMTARSVLVTHDTIQGGVASERAIDVDDVTVLRHCRQSVLRATFDYLPQWALAGQDADY